jgi:hypothetical protein
MVFCLGIYAWWLKYHLIPRLKSGRQETPEDRILIAMFGAPFIPVSLLFFGWTARPGVHWIVPIIGSAFYGPGIESVNSLPLLLPLTRSRFLFLGTITYLGAAYPRCASLPIRTLNTAEA